jgi:effector-binding domain-containing protein
MTRLEARIRQMNETVDHKSYDVILRDIGPELVATYREIVPDDDRIQYMFNEVETYVAGFDQARADKPPFTIYHDAEYREKDIDAEVAIPLKFSVPGTDQIHVRELPGVSNVASVVHSGSYMTLYQAYNALLSWIETNHYHMAGPIREVYLRYGADGLGFDLPPTYLGQDSNQYVTELQLHVEKS